MTSSPSSFFFLTITSLLLPLHSQAGPLSLPSFTGYTAGDIVVTLLVAGVVIGGAGFAIWYCWYHRDQGPVEVNVMPGHPRYPLSPGQHGYGTPQRATILPGDADHPRHRPAGQGAHGPHGMMMGAGPGPM